ncbi:hypothetical protein F2Q68_00032980, partial [Brassica cretica]
GTKASCALESELKRVDSRLDTLEGSIEEVKSRPFVSREELERVYEELKKVKVRDSLVSDVGIVDELRAYARGIVEKEIGKNGADGLGIVDYALGSGGGVFDGSFGSVSCWEWSGGYVQVSLRGPIVPEAVTLEHVSKIEFQFRTLDVSVPLNYAVAYDRSSAPKDCRVSGWLEEKDMESETMLLLNPKRCNSTETEPSLTPEIVPPPPPRPEPRSTSSPPIPDEDHHRDRDVETSRDQEDQPESRPDAPSRAAFLPRRSARDTRCVSYFEQYIQLCSCAIYFLSTILMLRFMHREIEQAVAYDRSSAPKDCRVSRWLEEKDIESETMLLLTEFTYDLDGSNAQIFDVADSARSGPVNTVRLDFTSNHEALRTLVSIDSGFMVVS